jgi:uncharacterized damage-inducible protein DinB
MGSIVTQQIAKHIRELHTGGNWTGSNLKDVLMGISWEQAVQRMGSFNTIATLVFHMNYYASALLRVLNGGNLDAHDKYSFDHPPVGCEADWQDMIDKSFRDAEEIACIVEKMPDNKLWDVVEQEKYGSYYRNLHGFIEHTYYHTGQIALLRKMIREAGPL